jgi:two-component system, OmpR family, copper resistance phosphate regulon response regulator CusR
MVDENHILVVEDDLSIANALKDGLETHNYKVTHALTGEDAFFILSSSQVDLVILDIMLPKRSGIEVLSAVRSSKNSVPVIIVTAKDSVSDRVTGLDSGADDYLVKPFAFPELLARIRTLLRRTRTEYLFKYQIGELAIDLKNRKVVNWGKPVDLTAKEFDILAYFCKNKGCIVSREMLARDVWQEAGRITPLDNVIDVHLARLRKKLDSHGHRAWIQTLRGVGFVLKGDDESME